MVFSSILQNDEPKPKIFWNSSGTKHPLYIITGTEIDLGVFYLVFSLYIVAEFVILGVKFE
jgi:hypothetical protein